MKVLLAVLALGLVLGRGERGEVRDAADRSSNGRLSVPLPSPLSPSFHLIVLPAQLRGMMSAVWVTNNRHWDELAGQNTLTQLLGTGQPTQLEYLGCLAGDVANDTLFVRRLVQAAHLKQLQFAVAGDCEGVPDFVGTWHTHPYHADAAGRAQKEPGLSALDLESFAAARDLVTIVMWDLDSLDAAMKTPDGALRHPAPVEVR